MLSWSNLVWLKRKQQRNHCFSIVSWFFLLWVKSTLSNSAFGFFFKETCCSVHIINIRGKASLVFLGDDWWRYWYRIIKKKRENNGRDSRREKEREGREWEGTWKDVKKKDLSLIRRELVIYREEKGLIEDTTGVSRSWFIIFNLRKI